MLEQYYPIPGSPYYDGRNDFAPDEREIFMDELHKLDGLTVDEIWQRKIA